jgi:uncharacterized membrane protein YbhN (UPF0104 family)
MVASGRFAGYMAWPCWPVPRLSFFRAGIGGMELVMTTLLVERGTALRVAIIATLLCRLATLWFAVLLGVAAASVVELSDHKMRVRVIP